MRQHRSPDPPQPLPLQEALGGLRLQLWVVVQVPQWLSATHAGGALPGSLFLHFLPSFQFPTGVCFPFVSGSASFSCLVLSRD